MHRRTLSRLLCLLLTCALLMTACGSVDTALLLGTWRANAAEYGIAEYTFNADGTCDFRMLGIQDYVLSQSTYTYVVQGNKLKVTNPSGTTVSYKVAIEGDKMTWGPDSFTRYTAQE